MSAKKVHSAAVLPYVVTEAKVVRVFVAHMGGPFWARKDNGGWSLAKGEFDPEIENSADAAVREFEEEVGVPVDVRLIDPLGEFRQPSGKRIHAFTWKNPVDLSFVGSNEFEMEWPKGSGAMQSFPEIDRAEWMDLATARDKLVKGQVPILDELMARIGAEDPDVGESSGGTQSALF